MAQLVTRVDDALVREADLLVVAGVVESRSAPVGAAWEHLVESEGRRRTAATIVRGYERVPQTETEIGWPRRGDDPDDRGRALVSLPAQSEIWWAEDKRRPVLVVTRSEAIRVLTWVVVAPVTRTVRSTPTEVPLGPDEGLPDACAASFDNLQPIRRAFLAERAGTRSPARRRELCGALAAFADC
jgi:mRNA interferase MazF